MSSSTQMSSSSSSSFQQSSSSSVQMSGAKQSISFSQQKWSCQMKSILIMSKRKTFLYNNRPYLSCKD